MQESFCAIGIQICRSMQARQFLYFHPFYVLPDLEISTKNLLGTNRTSFEFYNTVKTRIKKNMHFGVQADFVLIYWVISAKSA